MGGWRKVIAGFLTAALIVVVAAMAWLWLHQEKLLFFPQPLPPDATLAREPGVIEHQVPVDGATLSVLQLKLAQSRGVIFFLHGNAGNLEGWFTNTAFYREAGWDLVMPDYRGYGKSTGRVESEAQLHQDMDTVWAHFAPQYAGRKVVVYGRSLGTALAAEHASRLSGQGRAPSLTVLVTPYSSIRELASEIYPFIPSFLLRYPLETAQRAQGVRGPILLLHGDRDELIPVEHSRRLAAALPQASLVVVPGATHNDIHEFPAYREPLLQALRSL